MGEFFQVPSGITNVPRWEEQCRRIHARARDLIAGKLTVIQAALALNSLALQTRAENDADLDVFRKIRVEIIGLPVGNERQFWSQHALDREHVKIDAIERLWKPSAFAAAHRLTDKYRWALAARQRRRHSGDAV